MDEKEYNRKLMNMNANTNEYWIINGNLFRNLY